MASMVTREPLRYRNSTQNPFDEPAKWTIKVSIHSAFPWRGGPTGEAFEHASWQFHRSLETALVDLVAERRERLPG